MITAKQVKAHQGKLHIAAYSALIIAGMAGYTDLLLELGELRSDGKYYELSLQQLTDANYKLEENCKGNL